RRPRPDARADAGVHRGPDRRRPGHDGAGRSQPRHRRQGRRGTARSGGLHRRRARQPAGVPMTEVDAMTSADQPSAPWWRITRERMVRVGVLLWLALVYTALWGNMSAANVLAGLAIGTIIMIALPLPKMPAKGDRKSTRLNSSHV